MAEIEFTSEEDSTSSLLTRRAPIASSSSFSPSGILRRTNLVKSETQVHTALVSIALISFLLSFFILYTSVFSPKGPVRVNPNISRAAQATIPSNLR